MSTGVKGKTWEVYLFILTSNKPVGVREVWRKLGFSTPSLAQYHINKLVELELIKQVETGKYIVREKGNVGLLRSFVLLRGKLVPRLVFYGLFMMGLTISYFIYWPYNWSFPSLITFTMGLFSSLIFFGEAYLLVRSLEEEKMK